MCGAGLAAATAGFFGAGFAAFALLAFASALDFAALGFLTTEGFCLAALLSGSACSTGVVVGAESDSTGGAADSGRHRVAHHGWQILEDTSDGAVSEPLVTESNPQRFDGIRDERAIEALK